MGGQGTVGVEVVPQGLLPMPWGDSGELLESLGGHGGMDGTFGGEGFHVIQLDGIQLTTSKGISHFYRHVESCLCIIVPATRAGITQVDDTVCISSFEQDAEIVAEVLAVAG